MKLVLLHSPLTGPSTWRRLAPFLEALGHDVCVPDYRDELVGRPPYYDRIAQAIARQANGFSVLIVHSGAGALVPALASALPLHAGIFVDALLPHPGQAWFDTVSAETKTSLTGLVRNGRLPRWADWWPEGAIVAMIGDSAVYAQFVDELNESPLAYFQERAPSIGLPASLACGYLQLTAGYDQEAMEAERLGWPVRKLALHHLAMMTDCETVAGAIDELIDICK